MSVSTHDFNSHLRICLKETITDKESSIVPIQYLGPDPTSSSRRFDCDLESIGSRGVCEAVKKEEDILKFICQIVA